MCLCIAPVGPVHYPRAVCSIGHAQKHIAVLLWVRRNLPSDNPEYGEVTGRNHRLILNDS